MSGRSTLQGKEKTHPELFRMGLFDTATNFASDL